MTDCTTFAEVKAWLEAMPDYLKWQDPGRLRMYCPTGEPYDEFYAYNLARPGDELIVERFVARSLMGRLSSYFEQRNGPIYERVPLEWRTDPYSVVARLDKIGPDYDPVTGERCVMDHNWLMVKAYVRLCRPALKKIAA